MSYSSVIIFYRDNPPKIDLELLRTLDPGLSVHTFVTQVRYTSRSLTANAEAIYYVKKRLRLGSHLDLCVFFFCWRLDCWPHGLANYVKYARFVLAVRRMLLRKHKRILVVGCAKPYSNFAHRSKAKQIVANIFELALRPIMEKHTVELES